MLKTTLFRGTGIGGSRSWVLDFGSSINGKEDIYINKEGALYTAGTIINKVSTNFFIKVSAEGKILWQNYFKHKSNNTDSTNSCITTIGNNIVVGGLGSSAVHMGKDAQLGLYSADGVELATTGITSGTILGPSAAIHGISSNDSNIYAYGENYIVKLKKDLSSADWIKSLSDSTYIIVKCDPDNDYTYFCGNINSNSNIFYVGSLSSTGKQIWIKRIGSDAGKYAHICVTSDGVYAYSYYGILAKCTKSGSLLWTKEVVTGDGYYTNSTIDSDITGNIYIVNKACFTKLSSDGIVLSSIGMTSNRTDDGNCSISHIKTDARGNVYFWVITKSDTNYLVKLTKNDIKQIATATLTIGPLVFENVSYVKVNSSSTTAMDSSKEIISTKHVFKLTSSTFTATESNLTPELHYKG